jgi:hypothetical protein
MPGKDGRNGKEFDFGKVRGVNGKLPSKMENPGIHNRDYTRKDIVTINKKSR